MLNDRAMSKSGARPAIALLAIAALPSAILAPATAMAAAAGALDLRDSVQLPTISVTLPWTLSHADYEDIARGDRLQAAWEAYAALYNGAGPRLAAYLSLRLAKLLARDEVLRAHHVEQARRQLAIIARPTAADLLMRAEAEDLSGDEARCLDTLKEALRQHPNDPRVYRAVASHALRRGFGERFPGDDWKRRGAALFARLAGRGGQPASFYVDYFLFRYHLGAAQLERAKSNDAYAAYLELVAGLPSQGLVEQALRRDPREPRWHALLGGLTSGHVYVSVLEILVPLLRKGKDRARDPRMLAAAFRRAYRQVKPLWRRAHLALERARRLAPTRYPVIYRHLAYLEAVRGRFDRSAQLSRRALSLGGGDLPALNLLLFALRILSASDAAAARAGAAEVRDTVERLGLERAAVAELSAAGKILFESGDPAGARAALDLALRGLAAEPKAPKEVRARALALHASVLLKSAPGSEAAVIRELEACLALSSDPELVATAQLDLAVARRLQGDRDGALRAAEAALKARPAWKSAASLLERLRQSG